MGFLLNIIVLCLLVVLFFPKARVFVSIIVLILLFTGMIRYSYEGIENNIADENIVTGIHILGQPTIMISDTTPSPEINKPKGIYDTSPYKASP